MVVRLTHNVGSVFCCLTKEGFSLVLGNRSGKESVDLAGFVKVKGGRT